MEIQTLTILVIVSCVAVIVALVISLMALNKAKAVLKINAKPNLEKIVEEYVPRYLGYRGRRLITEAVREEMAEAHNAHKVPEVNREPYSSPVYQQQQHEVNKEKEQQPSPAPIKESQPEHAAEEISLPTPITLYTGSYSTGAFRHITTSPDDKTIFTIYANDKDAEEGVLNIDASAYDKVSETPDYLKNACSYSGAGSKIRIVQVGRVVKENGSWVVKDPVIAEFN